MERKTNDIYKEICRLLEQGGVSNARREAAWLTEAFLGCAREDLYRPEPAVRDTRALFSAVRKRATGEPLQYLLGSQGFMGMEIKVGRGVLIPREDTEILCRAAAEGMEGSDRPVVFDLCAGSGCVSLGVCSLIPDARVFAVEKYAGAFRWLLENIKKYPQYDITPIRADLLKILPEGLPEADVIVSNPPYIDRKESPLLQAELFREPARALFAGDCGLRFFSVIAKLGAERLKTGGKLAAEIGSGQAERVCEIFERCGYRDIAVICDAAGRDRVVRCRKARA